MSYFPSFSFRLVRPGALLVATVGLLTLTAPTARAQQSYVSPKMEQFAQKHRKLAALPFAVTLELRPAEVARMGGPSGLEDAQEREGYRIQEYLTAYLQDLKNSKKLTVEIVPSSEVNQKLQAAGIGPENLSQHSYAELAKLVGADGLLNGTYLSTQPLSTGAAIGVMALTGFSMPTNTGQLSMSLNDGPTGELLWKYDKSLSRDLGSDTHSVIYTIMRKAERQFPYAKGYKP